MWRILPHRTIKQHKSIGTATSHIHSQSEHSYHTYKKHSAKSRTVHKINSLQPTIITATTTTNNYYSYYYNWNLHWKASKTPKNWLSFHILSKETPFILMWCQFPIVIAVPLTIKTSQEQDFQRLGIYLPTPVISHHGKLYVMLSHCISLDTVKVLIEPSQ
jgi:hypothetical protein